MVRLISTISGTFLLYIVLGEKKSKNFHPLWNYEDQSAWPGDLCQEYNGVRQSPIDIRTSYVVQDLHKKFIRYGPLQLTGYDKVLLTGINNGHTILFSTDGDESMHPTITGGPLKYTYRLEQLHFHWLSEHAVDGNKYPMEIHFLHVRSDLTVPEALLMPDGLAIMAVFCNVKTDKEKTISTDEIMQYMPHLKNVGDRISGVLINAELLLSSNRQSYYSYAGSLTSPSCNEVVTWIIFKHPIYTSDAHYLFFSKVGEGSYNFRSLQPMSHHVVYSPSYHLTNMPATQFVKMFNDIINLVKKLYANTANFMLKAYNKAG